MDCWYVALNEFNDNGEEDDDDGGGDETKKNLTTTKKKTCPVLCICVMCMLCIYMCLDWIELWMVKKIAASVSISSLYFLVWKFFCCYYYCCCSRGLGSSKHTHTHTQQFFAVSLVQIDW